MKRTWIIIFLLLLIGSACQEETTEENGENNNGTNPSILRTATKHEQRTSEQAEAIVHKEHEFKEVTAVNSDDLIVIGVDPLHHDRFRLNEFRNDLKNNIESSFKSYDVELSTDKKIILELNKLKEQLKEESVSQAQLKKELERIRNLSKEQA